MAQSKKKTVRVRRIFDVRPFEKAWVPAGANGVPLLVVKSDQTSSEENTMRVSLESIAKARGLLMEVEQVLKSGMPDVAAEDALGAKVTAAVSLLYGEELAVVGKTIKSELSGIAAGLAQLAARNVDIGLADHLDTLHARVLKVAEVAAGDAPAAPAIETPAATPEAPAIEAPAAPAAQAASATPATPAPPADAEADLPTEAAKACATDEKETKKADGADAPTSTPAAPQPTTAVATPAPAIETPAAVPPAPAPAPAAVAPAAVAPVAPTGTPALTENAVTKGDLEALRGAMTEMLATFKADILKETQGLVTKSLTLPQPAHLPVQVPADPTPEPEAPRNGEEISWPMDFNSERR